MKNLNEKKWKPIQLNEYFKFIRGRENNMGSLKEGETPLVSAKANNNGIKGFVNTTQKIIKGNCITLNNDGDGGAGLAYYQPMKMALDSHVTALVPIQNLKKNELIFISECISGLHGFFGHGLSISNARANKIKVMLPVIHSNKPDYTYMRQYVAEKQDGMLMRYKKYVIKCLSKLQYKEIPRLKEKEWQEFNLENIFTVSPGKRLETRNKIPGNRPFIGATDNNNGVTGFVGNSNESKDNNVLGVNYNGAPCIAFYHPYECIFTDDVKRLHLKNYNDNKFILLFFTEIFAMQKSKYNYGYKFKEKRMLRQKLMLPVDTDKKPDYKYMEQYIKNIMIKKYKQYLSFLDRKMN